jgi:rhamnogalacturonyl hydrolase YesR
MQRKSWEQGVLGTAFVEAGDNELVVQMARASRIYTSKDGVVAALDGAPVDPLMAGEVVWKAAQISGDPSLRKAADDMLAYALKTAPRASDGTIYHTGRAMWSDSFHTSPPFLAMAGQYDEAIRQIDGHWKRLWNPEARLVSHIWDEGRQQFADKNFWGGGNGWTAAGLTRVIRALPADRQADRQRLIGYVRAVIDGCLAHQTAGGLFHDVVDNPNSYEETNLAQMLSYSIYEGVRGGWLSQDYLKAADRMHAAARAKVDAHGFVQGVAAAPTFDRPGISPEGQAFFLLMETAADKMAAIGQPQMHTDAHGWQGRRGCLAQFGASPYATLRVYRKAMPSG